MRRLLLAAALLTSPASGAPPDAVTGATPPGGKAERGSEDFPRTRLMALQRRRLREARRAPVIEVRALDPAEAAVRLLEQLLPDPDPARPVLIKPNVGGFSSLKSGPDPGVLGRVTDPRFVEGVVRYLREKGVRRLTIADGRGVRSHAEMDRVFAAAGYPELVARHPGVSLLGLNYFTPDHPTARLVEGIRFPVVRTLPAGRQLLVPRVYLEHLMDGLVINVAKLKAHRFTVLSGGLKNLMGVLRVEGDGRYPGNRPAMHREYVELARRLTEMPEAAALASHRASQVAFLDRLTDALGVLLPHLTLLDGVLACEGTGFHDSSSVPLHLALGGRHPVLVDAVAAERVGLGRPLAVERACKRLGACEPLPAAPLVLGRLGVRSRAPFEVVSTMEEELGRGGVYPVVRGEPRPEDFGWLPRTRRGARLRPGSAVSVAWVRRGRRLSLRVHGHRLPEKLVLGWQIRVPGGELLQGNLDLDAGRKAVVEVPRGVSPKAGARWPADVFLVDRGADDPRLMPPPLFAGEPVLAGALVFR